MRKAIYLLPLLLAMGCQSTASLINKITGKNHESAQVYTTGVVDTLSLVTNKTQEVELASSLAGSAQEIEGLPPSGKRLNVKALLNQDKDELKELSDRRADDSINAEKLRKAEAKLLELGAIKEAENNRSFWSKLVATFGLLGAIGVLVGIGIVCPPAALAIMKLLGMFFGWLVSKIPSLIHGIGVVGSSAFTNVVQSIGNVRQELKSDIGKTYTAEQVLRMLDGELSIQTDRSDKAVIEAVRKKLQI